MFMRPVKTVKTIIILHKMDIFLDEKDITIVKFYFWVYFVFWEEPLSNSWQQKTLRLSCLAVCLYRCGFGLACCTFCATPKDRQNSAQYEWIIYCQLPT
jgi:hypothetical protein